MPGPRATRARSRKSRGSISSIDSSRIRGGPILLCRKEGPMRRALVLWTIAVALGASLARAADEYPVRAVRVVVPFAPGGGTDVVGRILAQQLSQRLGQSFVIENKPAGSGIVGADFVAKAQGDGYTL